LRSRVAAHKDTSLLALEESQAFPDPTLTASIYCHAALDELVAYAIVPFRKGLRAQDLPDISLWLLRYGKGGEHLKIRIHGAPENCRRLQGLLENSLEAAWAQIPLPSAERSIAWRGAPPVDEEDTTSDDHPDRTLLWTHYRRSSVSLGGGGLLENDRYVSLVTGCLAAGCDRVLDVFQEHGSPIPLNKKQKTLIAIFTEALAVVDWSSSLRKRYLTYHRDSLFRFLLAPSETPEDGATNLFDRCEENLSKVRDPDSALSVYLRESWDHSQDTVTTWQQAVADLYQWFSGPQILPCRLDPFAWDPRFTPIFKILHGVSNQLGVNLLNEGFLCHLLLAAMGVERPPVGLYPDWEWADS